MASIILIHPEEQHEIPVRQAINKCSLFEDNPKLVSTPYTIQTSIPITIFRDFVSELKGNTISITESNFSGLSQLSEEFGFGDFRTKLSEFRSSIKSRETETRTRIAFLEEKAQSYDSDIATLQSDFAHFLTKFELFETHISVIRSLTISLQKLQEEVSTLKTEILQNFREPIAEQLSKEVAEVRETISVLWQFPLVPRIDSRIISDFPKLFGEFRGKRFSLLWRGSRDGFTAKGFHGRCDGHGNTLTVILDTKGNIFGGFTPIIWESSNRWKVDESLKSFLFTLKNPHNFTSTRFILKVGMKHQAIWCDSIWGPCFGDGDLGVSDNSNSNTNSNCYLGIVYTNDTGLDRSLVFTGSAYFKVKEIEVFEIIE
jgi:hypothetical protein